MRKELLFTDEISAAREATKHSRCKLEQVTITTAPANMLTGASAKVETRWKLTLFNRDKVI
jgi:hypothetical protein